MNRTQRNRNRKTALELHWKVLASTKCPNCGELGPHWIVEPMTLEEILGLGHTSQGFWTCPIYYGEDGRRISPEAERALDEKIALSKVTLDEQPA